MPKPLTAKVLKLEEKEELNAPHTEALTEFYLHLSH
jgi:hypothetical protein